MEEGETEVPLNYTGMLVYEEGGGKKVGGGGEVINVWCIWKYIHLHDKASHTHIHTTV